MTRQKKTPRQRAEETVAAARRRVDRLITQHTAAKATAEQLGAELDEARQRLTYAQQDPALPRPTNQPGGSTA